MRELRQLEQFTALPYLLKWFSIACIVGVLAGTASAALLATLDWATEWRESHVWIIALLPLGGLLSGLIYHRFGKTVEAGNNLLLEEIHNPKDIIPLRMAPLVLLGTDLTHLFGGSAGREGTALQMGASLADQLTKVLRFHGADRRILLTAGISGGFASVFGTPLAGTVFGLEVLAIGKLRYDALFPCLVTAVVGNQVTLMFGLHHTAYRHASSVPAMSIVGLICAIVAGIIFGITARVFAQTTHQINHWFKGRIAFPPLRPFLGGIVVAAIVGAIGTTRYIGLGIPTIVESFSTPLPPWDFAAKLGLTALTLGAGFKGGEVTPLFFIGAALGSALSMVLALPTPLLAGMGFVGVFAGAANTPIASTLMGIELFGLESGAYVGIACVLSYLFSGHAGIYASQRIGLSKYSSFPVEEGLSLSAHARSRSLPEIDVFTDLHFLGFLQSQENNSVPYLASLRLYFHQGARLKQTTVWQKLTAPTLSMHLPTCAKTFGIQQVVLHRVAAGFLQGDPLHHDYGEIPPHRLPQCLELVDRAGKLRQFVEKHQADLQGVRAVLVRCDEIPLDLAEVTNLQQYPDQQQKAG